MISGNGRVDEREEPAATVAGFLAAASIFVSAMGLVYKPVRLIPAATIVALIAVAMGGRHRRLASIAVAVAFVCWIVGMTIAIATGSDVY